MVRTQAASKAYNLESGGAREVGSLCWPRTTTSTPHHLGVAEVDETPLLWSCRGGRDAPSLLAEYHLHPLHLAELQRWPRDAPSPSSSSGLRWSLGGHCSVVNLLAEATPWWSLLSGHFAGRGYTSTPSTSLSWRGGRPDAPSPSSSSGAAQRRAPPAGRDGRAAAGPGGPAGVAGGADGQGRPGRGGEGLRVRGVRRRRGLATPARR